MAATNPFQTQNYNIKNPFLEGGATGMPQVPVGPEVNLRGDAANGFSGSLTSKSLSNAVMQKPTVSGGKSGNVFADMLQHSMTLGNLPNQKTKKIVTRGASPFQPNPTLNQPGGLDENGQPIFLQTKGDARSGDRPFPITNPPTPPPSTPSDTYTDETTTTTPNYPWDVPWNRNRNRGDRPGTPPVTSAPRPTLPVNIAEQGPPATQPGPPNTQLGPPSDYANAARKYSQDLTQAWGTPIAVTEVDVRRFQQAPPEQQAAGFEAWYRQNGGVEWNTNNPEAMASYWQSQPGYEGVNPQAIQQYDAYKKSAQGGQKLDFDQFYDIYMRPFDQRRAPRGNEDSRIAAQWYSRFVPGGGVTPQDVDAYRANPKGLDFATWWNQGGRASGTGTNPQFEARSWGGGARPGAAYQRSLGPIPDQMAQVIAPTTSTPPGTGAPPSSTPPPATGAGSSTGTGSSSSTSTSTQTPNNPTLMDFNAVLDNVIKETSNRFNPLFEKQQGDLQRQLMHTGSVTGATKAGGFGSVVGDALTGLSAEQGAILGKEISEQTKNMTQLATQKYVAELGVMVQQEQIRTNADLERAAQELQKYGIDKNDLLDRYKAELGLKGQMYSADRGVDAAALHAAASSAAAGAQAAAARYDADVRRELGILGYDVERENNVMRYILGIASLGPEWAKWISSSDPAGLFPNGFGNVVTVR